MQIYLGSSLNFYQIELFASYITSWITNIFFEILIYSYLQSGLHVEEGSELQEIWTSLAAFLRPGNTSF